MLIWIVDFYLLCIPMIEHNFVKSVRSVVDCHAKVFVGRRKRRIEDENRVRYSFTYSNFGSIKMDRGVLLKIDVFLLDFANVV